ncbi:MAG: hypothetical protein ACOYNY_20315 [Caldilineaceae bacterium]
MNDVTVTTNEKSRLNVHIEPGVKEKLVTLAGGERQIGVYLGNLADRLTASNPQVEYALLDAGSLKQVGDAGIARHDTVSPALDMAQARRQNRPVFAIDLWRNGRREQINHVYDDRSYGWSSGAAFNAALSATLAQLGTDGWTVAGVMGNAITLQRVAPVVPA